MVFSGKKEIHLLNIELQDVLLNRWSVLVELTGVCCAVQIMKRLLEQLNNSSASTEQRLSVLLELEYMVHQVNT